MYYSTNLELLKNYDIIGLCETWKTDLSEYTDILQDYHCYSSKSHKVNRYGRASGGIAVLIKNNFVKYVKRLYRDYDKAVFLLIDSGIGLDKDLIYVSTYIQPENSPIYNQPDEANGIEDLKRKLAEILESVYNVDILISGDFNARIGNKLDIFNDDIAYLPLGDWYNQDNFKILKNSKDKTENNFGVSLIDLCCEFGLHILNGRHTDDISGEFTCITYNGASVVDYVIVNSDLYNKICKFKIINQISNSKHFPLTCNVNLLHNMIETQNSNSECKPRIRYKWEANLNVSFRDNLIHILNDQYTVIFDEFITNNDINSATLHVVKALQEAAEPMKQTLKCSVKIKEKTKQQPPWWDYDCNKAKHEKYNSLDLFRRYNTVENLNAYTEKKKFFKLLCVNKMKIYKNTMYNTLKSSVDDTNEFWKTVKNFSSNGKHERSSITCKAWESYFQKLLSSNSNINEDFSLNIENFITMHDAHCDDCELNDLEILNSNIDIEEVKLSIKSLKNNKSPGLDGLEGELFKENIDLVAPILCKLYNGILHTGVYPDSWSEAMLIPIFKKG